MTSRTLRAALVALLLLVPTGARLQAQTAITWTSLVNITQTVTEIKKTPGANELFDAGALSTESITEGTFTFTLNAVGDFYVGLSTDAATDNTMSHSFRFLSETGAGQVYIVESGSVVSTTDSAISDTYSLVIGAGGSVVYKRNGSTVYTSLATATTPAKLDFSARVSNSAISGATYTDAGGGVGSGSVRTVCASGCDHTTIQAAITAAVAGDTILTEEGATFTEDLSLPQKASVGASARITIRTGVSSTGVIQSTSRYPAEGVRICPQNYSVDDYSCAGKAGETPLSRLTKIKPATNNAYAIRTASTATGTPVSYYTLQWLQVIPNAFAGNSLIGILNETATANDDPTQHLPHNIVIDRVVVGEEGVAQFRGAQIDGNSVTIKNSHFMIQANAEGQAIWANTSIGPLTVENNYLCCATEVFLTGGSGTTIRPNFTVQASPAPNTTVFTLSGNTNLYVGKSFAIHQRSRTVSTISTATAALVTTSTDHGYSVGQQAWFSGVTGCTLANGATYGAHTIMSVPSSTTFTVKEWRTGGSICASGAGSGGTVVVRASAEITGLSGNQVTVTPAVPFTPVAGEVVETSLVISDMTIRYNYVTRPMIWKTVNPNSWDVKNTFELKVGINSTIEYNIIENAWQDGQSGPCVPFTATQQDTDADSAVIRDIDFRYNVVRHCGQWLQFTGTDALGHESARSGDLRFHDNLIYDVSNTYATATGASISGSGGGYRQGTSRAPYDLSFVHNTIHYTANAQNNLIYFDYCYAAIPVTGTGLESNSPNTIWRDNIAYSGTYGMLSTLTGNNCSDGQSEGRLGASTLGTGSSINNNALVGGTSNAGYVANTTNMTFPSVASIESGTFTNVVTIGGFAVKSSSTYYAGAANDATDGLSMGADIAEILEAMLITESGNNAPPVASALQRFRLRFRGLFF